MRSNPGSADAYSLAAQAALAMGEIKQTEKFLLAAVEIRPDSSIVHRNLGIFLSQIHREEDANRAFNEALKIDPRDSQTLYCYATHLYSHHHAKEAQNYFLKAVEFNPRNPSIWSGLANTQRSLGDKDAAKHSYLTALKFEPNHLPAINDLGALSSDAEDYNVASNYFKRSLALNSAQPRVWYNLGVSYQWAGRLNDAIEAFRRALEIDPSSVEILEALGRTFQKQNAHKDAIKVFRRACDIAPHNAQMFYFLACGHIGDDNIDEARTVCMNFLETHPGDATMLSCLALMAAEHGPEEEDAKYNRFDAIIQTVKVPTPEPFKSEQNFIQVLIDHILSHSTLRDAGKDHATRNGLHTGNLRLSGMGPINHLKDCIARSIDDYVDFLRQNETNEFIASRQPKDWDLNIWGVAMKNQGHQLPHFHPDAWLSGCFYAQLPPVTLNKDGGQEGWIEFGAPPNDFTSVGDYQVKAFQPIVGSMFLFPGYLTHRTIPYNSDDVRISIAFDIVPV